MSSIYGSNRKDNSGLNFVLLIVCGFLFSAFGIWAIVEFILYLVKDNPFNWTSLTLTIIAFVGEIFFMIRSMLSD